MQVAVLCSQLQRQELGPVAASVIFVENLEALVAAPAAVLIDLLFEDYASQHLPLLQNYQAGAVIVHSVVATVASLPPHFVRINAWPTFLSGPVAEVCGGTDAAKERTGEALALLGKVPEWVPDVPGMVSARIIASILNEAYFTLSEGVARREAIDTAMKLGTAYPYGPFEWGEKIGLRRISHLLQVLSQTQSRYQPCTLLLEEGS